MFQQAHGGICINIKVIPKASRSAIVGWENNELKVRLAAVPDKGAANVELLRFLGRVFDVGMSKIILLQGATSRHKRICVMGLSVIQIEEKLQTSTINKEK